jgi:hypothetical protein
MLLSKSLGEPEHGGWWNIQTIHVDDLQIH